MIVNRDRIVHIGGKAFSMRICSVARVLLVASTTRVITRVVAKIAKKRGKDVDRIVE